MSIERRRGRRRESVALGTNGLAIPAATHICAFFRGIPERDRILVPFLVEGLRAGQKCTCIIDDGVDAVRTTLAAATGLPAEAGSHHLDIRSSKETYLRRGTFSTHKMLDFWDESVGSALSEESFQFVRSGGETTWTLKELPDTKDFLTYEAELNRVL